MGVKYYIIALEMPCLEKRSPLGIETTSPSYVGLANTRNLVVVVVMMLRTMTMMWLWMRMMMIVRINICANGTLVRFPTQLLFGSLRTFPQY